MPHSQHPAQPACQRLAYTLEQLEQLTSVSRSQLYLEIASGRLVASQVGRRRLITHENALRWLAALPTSVSSGEAA